VSLEHRYDRSGGAVSETPYWPPTAKPRNYGSVRYVTNLNDSGPGSLRWAVEGPGPRTVKVAVTGTIRLKTPLNSMASDLCVEGNINVVIQPAEEAGALEGTTNE